MGQNCHLYEKIAMVVNENEIKRNMHIYDYQWLLASFIYSDILGGI